MTLDKFTLPSRCPQRTSESQSLCGCSDNTTNNPLLRRGSASSDRACAFHSWVLARKGIWEGKGERCSLSPPRLLLALLQPYACICFVLSFLSYLSTFCARLTALPSGDGIVIVTVDNWGIGIWFSPGAAGFLFSTASRTAMGPI